MRKSKFRKKIKDKNFVYFFHNEKLCNDDGF